MKMTVSLLQSYDWLKVCPDFLKAKAKAQLIGMLNKEPFDSKATERGNKYEDLICQALRNGEPVDPALEVLRGKRQQGWIQAVTVRNFTFKGKMDFDDSNEIWDLKTTKKFDVASYYTKKQHLVYCLAEKKEKFTYKVAVFADETGLEPLRIETIPITVELKRVELDLYAALGEFENWLKRESLWDLYYDSFNGGNA